MNKWWSGLTAEGVLLRLVEVEKASRPPAMTEEIARSIQTLQSHPGFLYLLAKCRFQRSVLKETLATTRQASNEDCIMFQSGVAWSGWLQNEMETAINFKASPSAPPSRDELAIFEESQRQLEVLR